MKFSQMKYFTSNMCCLQPTKSDSLTFCAEKSQQNMKLDLLELHKNIGLSHSFFEKSLVSLQHVSLPTWDKNLTCNKKGKDGVTK